MKFNKMKYITILTYIITQCEDKHNFGKTVLNYILYFIDFNYYEIWGRSLTNETYKKSKKGLIVSTHFNEVIKELVRFNLLFTRKEDYFHRKINKYYITKFGTNSISYFEKMVADDVIKKLANFNARDISEYACSDSPYILANFNENLNYYDVVYRDENYSNKDLIWNFYY